MLLIFSEEITPRIKYITQLIFTQILQVEILLTSNSADFKNSTLPKINYSFKKFTDEFYIKPNQIMQSNTLVTPTINSVWYNGEKYFFESSEDSILPFDPLAASFYLVTRYEEYTEKTLDKFGRYPVEKSILTKYNLLKKPIVNIWANLLAIKLTEKYPNFKFPKRNFKFISTIDVDNAWAYKHKGFIRTSGAILKSVAKGNLSELKSRLKVLTGTEKDPYDSYEYLDSVFKGNEEKIKFFFLLGDYKQFDKNISHRNKHYKNLIQNTKEKYSVGIHPSFASSKNEGEYKVKMEKTRLEKISKSEVVQSRQHYLQLKFPKTYRQLIKAGITEDYTMGYSAQIGFRAGICTPFYFYDLKKEKTTNLSIIPFQIMDGTLRHYLQLSVEDALTEIENIIHEIKNVGGTFVTIWHNETVNNKGLWEGYQQLFEKINKLGFEWANE